MEIIPKFQQGGGLESLFTTYHPILPTRRRSSETTTRESTTSTTKKDDDDEKGELTKSLFFTMLKEQLKALPNDSKRITDNLIRLFKLTDAGVDVGSLETRYLSTLLQITQASSRKDDFDSAYKQAVAKGYMSDLAIDEFGQVKVLDKNNKILSIDIDKYKKNTDKYKPLTYANLLWMSKDMPQFSGDYKLIFAAQSGISLDDTHKMIKDRFLTLGETTIEESQYISKNVAEGVKTLKALVSSGPEGYYKITSKLTTVDDKLILAALNYIYSTLPNNARNKLRMETKNGTHEEALNIIKDLLVGTVKTTQTTNITHAGTDKSLGLSVDMTKPMSFYSGYGDKQSFVINPGSNNAIMVNSNIMPLTDKEDKVLGANRTLQQVSDGTYNAILDFTNVSIAGKHIDTSRFGEVVISDGKIASIDFPCTVNKETGEIIPLLSKDVIEKKSKADKEIRSRGIDLNNKESIQKNYATINQIYINNGLSTAYNSSGELSNSSWARFGVMNAKVSSRVVGEGNELLVKDADEANYVKITKLEDWDPDDWGIVEGNADILYKGTVWIPIRPNLIGASKNLKSDEALNIDARLQAQEAAKNLVLGRQLQ